MDADQKCKNMENSIFFSDKRNEEISEGGLDAMEKALLQDATFETFEALYVECPAQELGPDMEFRGSHEDLAQAAVEELFKFLFSEVWVFPIRTSLKDT